MAHYTGHRFDLVQALVPSVLASSNAFAAAPIFAAPLLSSFSSVPPFVVLGSGQGGGIDGTRMQWESPMLSVANINSFQYNCSPGLPYGAAKWTNKNLSVVKEHNSYVGECKNLLIRNPNTGSSYYNLGYSANYYYAGLDSFDPGANVDLCRIAFFFTASGNVTGKTFSAQVWSKSGTDLDTLLGESDGVVGRLWPSTGGLFVLFFFTTPVSLTNGTQYAITATMKEIDSSNYVRLYYSTPVVSGLGTISYWNSSKTRMGGNSGSLITRIYVR